MGHGPCMVPSTLDAVERCAVFGPVCKYTGICRLPDARIALRRSPDPRSSFHKKRLIVPLSLREFLFPPTDSFVSEIIAQLNRPVLVTSEYRVGDKDRRPAARHAVCRPAKRRRRIIGNDLLDD
jgi:hypothetical protein